MFLVTTSMVRPSSSVGLNSTTSVPAYRIGVQGWLEVAQRCGCATPSECALFDAPERGSGDPVLALRVVQVAGSDCRRPG